VTAAIQVTAAGPADEPVLWLMLTYAASMGAGGVERIAEAQADPYLRTYVAGWGSKRGDLGVVARASSGEPIGAAWLRLGDGGGPFKLGDEATPELATAVTPGARGQGVGSLLMKALIEAARPHFPRLVLSVREENRAARFYGRLGFREVSRMKNRVGGDSLVMTLELTAPGDRP
jgi:ribosomal protein S18 acetylase RimI-like enzyme